jgi:hypothetical protein
MLAPYRERLIRLRTDPETWSEVAFVAHRNENGDWEDTHYSRRFGVLVCLQYDRQDTDESLIRYLFREEIKARQEDPFQGVSTALELAGFLLARFRRVEDLWLFWEAKHANFDTSLGFNFQTCFAAGIEETLAEVQKRDTREANAFRQWLKKFTPAPTPEEMATWWETMERTFPASEAEEVPLMLVQRALQLNDVPAGRFWLDRTEATMEIEPSSIQTLMYYRAELGQYEKALECARRKRTLAGSRAWDQASATLDIVNYAAAVGEWEEGYRELDTVLTAFAHHPDWKAYGLSRSALEATLALVEAMPPDEPRTRELFARVAVLIEQGFMLSYTLLKKAERISQTLEETEFETYYAQQAEQERERILEESGLDVENEL